MLQENTQTAGGVVFHVFDPVTVQLSIDRSNVQHMKLSLCLVQPQVSQRSLLPVNPPRSVRDRFSLSTHRGQSEVVYPCQPTEVSKTKRSFLPVKPPRSVRGHFSLSTHRGQSEVISPCQTNEVSQRSFLPVNPQRSVRLRGHFSLSNHRGQSEVISPCQTTEVS